MGRYGRIVADFRHVRDDPPMRDDRLRTDTTAATDRAILDLLDCGLSVEDIAAELGLADHLVEQAVAQFEGDAA